MQIKRFIAGAVLAAVLVSTSAAHAQGTVAPASACPTELCTAPIGSSQLQNLSQLKDEIRTYYTNGSYDREVAAIESDAARYIDQRVAAGVNRPALVLDIDDTALSTVGYELAHDFAYDAASWDAYADSPGFPPVKATVALVKHAQSEGVAIFFITGRRVAQTSLTTKNLSTAGYTYVRLYLRPPDDHAPSVVPYKSAERAQIEQLGYTILETIGDQWSDLEGGHAERAYKLPNPMYYLP